MARRTIVENYIIVLGEIWWPYGAKASTRINLSQHDLNNIGDFTRDNVEDWLSTHSGDFSRIIDFYATKDDIYLPWSSEENEAAYYDTLPSED